MSRHIELAYNLTEVFNEITESPQYALPLFRKWGVSMELVQRTLNFDPNPGRIKFKKLKNGSNRLVVWREILQP